MNFYINKYKKVCQYSFHWCIAWIKERAVSYQLFRRLRGGTWYFVCEISTGDEFWTDREPEYWEAMVIEKEVYE